jgi:hypothetical protein
MPHFTELVIEGPRGVAFGFVLGCLGDRAAAAGVLDAEAEGVDCAPMRERLGDLLSHGRETLHLLVPDPLLDEVRSALRKAAHLPSPITLKSERPVEARFTFALTVANPEHASRLRSLLEPKGGLRQSFDTRWKESRDLAADSVDLYAPAHPYELSGRGSIEGPVDEVLSLHRLCRDEELLHLGALEFCPRLA